MTNIITIFARFFEAIMKFIFSPIVVFRKGRDKVLHFYIWAILQFIGIFLGYGGEAGIGLIIVAIIKEEIIDGIFGMGVKDLMDAYWSFKGVIWATLLYLLVVGPLL